MTTERRCTAGAVELRSTTGTDEGNEFLQILAGYALKYNRFSQNLGGFVEQVAPGSLTKTLADGGDVLARFQHKDAYLLGRTSAGTLNLRSDDVGLDYSVTLPDTSYARDLAALAARGDVRHSSFAFRVIPGGDDWSVTDQDFPLRTIREMQLLDVAPVVTPAYMDTTSGLRSLATYLDRTEEEVREALDANRAAELIRKPEKTTIDLKLDGRALVALLGAQQGRRFEGLLPVEKRGALPIHHTAVVDKPWNGPGTVAKLKDDDTAAFRKVFAWYDDNAPDTDKDDGYPDEKSAWKFPHHEVADDGTPGAANVDGVRNALSRLPQAKIPDGDRKAVQAHLQAHLDDFKKTNQKSSPEDSEVPVTEPGETHSIAAAARKRQLQLLALCNTL